MSAMQLQFLAMGCIQVWACQEIVIYVKKVTALILEIYLNGCVRQIGHPVMVVWCPVNNSYGELRDQIELLVVNESKGR